MKILWAVDILENHPKAINAMSRFLKALHTKMPIEVDAVSVVRLDQLSPPNKIRKESRKFLEARLGGVRREEWFNSGHVLFESQTSQRVAVMDLIKFAQKGSYNGIVAVKHSKIGRKRAYLGSFAEMLSFLAPIPLFLVNPDGIIPKKIEKVLLATDAGLECGREFRKLSQFLPLSETTIQLHHRIPFVFPNILSKLDQELYRKSETKRATECLSVVEEIATRLGSTTKKSIKQENRATEDSIVSEASENKSDLIVLTHKGKGAVGFFLGGITRRVIQNADRPVLLFRV